jgi:hypothetical protein
MQKVQVITHGGRQIFFVNLKGCDLEQVKAVIAEAKPLIQRQPRESVLFLADLTDIKFSPDVVDALREFARHNTTYVRMSALVGLSGIREVALNSFRLHTGRIFMPFNNLEDAKDWLATMAADPPTRTTANS